MKAYKKKHLKRNKPIEDQIKDIQLLNINNKIMINLLLLELLLQEK